MNILNRFFNWLWSGQDMTKLKWKFYKDPRGKWRWQAKHANGNIAKASTQGYFNKKECLENARLPGYKG